MASAAMSDSPAAERQGRPHSSLAGVGHLDAASVVACGAVIVGAAIRLSNLGTQSIWFDEAYAVSLGNLPFSDIVDAVEPAHPPLYFMLLRVCTLLLGQSEISVRFLSVVSGVLSVALTYNLGKRLFGARVGAAACAIAAVSPNLIYYSQETRMYSLMVAQVLLSTCLLLRAVDGDRWYWAAYVPVAVSLLYTHYYGVLFFVAQALAAGAWLWLRIRARASHPKWSDLSAWWLAQGAVALSLLPWVIYRAQTLGTFASTGLASLGLNAALLQRILWETAVAFSSGLSIEAPGSNQLDPSYYRDHYTAAVVAVGFVALAVLALAHALLCDCQLVRRFKTPRQSSPLMGSVVVTAILVAFPVALAYLPSMVRQDFTARYLIGASPAFYLLMACGVGVLGRRSKWLGALAAAFVLAASVLSVANYFGDSKYWRHDFRACASFLSTNSSLGEVILCNAGYAACALDYYYRGEAPRVQLSREDIADQLKTEQTLKDLVGVWPYIWLVLYQDYYSDPNQYVEKWLDGHALLVSESSFHGGIRVKGYLTRPPIVDESSVPNVVRQDLGGEVELVGYEFAEPVAGRENKITLYWKALVPLVNDYTVFVHMVSPAGDRWAQYDSQPVHGSYPTSRWVPGQIVEDEAILDVPSFTPPVAFELHVGMYQLQPPRRLGSPGRDTVVIKPVWVRPEPNANLAVANRLDAEFSGQLALRGYELTGVEPGGQMYVTLFWQALSNPGSDYVVLARLLDSRGNVVSRGDAPPAQGIYPTSAWRAGEVVRDTHALSLPATLQRGEYQLIVGLSDASSGQQLETKVNFLSSDTEVVLRTISID